MRAIDADELLAEYDRHHKGPVGGARKLIEDAPTIRTIQPEIVRCKDCRHFKQVFAPNDNDGLCGHWHSKCDARTNRNDYCSHAERREVTEC